MEGICWFHEQCPERAVLRYATSTNESSLPAEGKIGVIPLSGHNGAKSDFRNDRVKRGQGFTEGGMPFSMDHVYRSQWKRITPCISIARETVLPDELPRRSSGDARKFALQGARGVILRMPSSAMPPRSSWNFKIKFVWISSFFFFFLLRHKSGLARSCRTVKVVSRWISFTYDILESRKNFATQWFTPCD